MLVSIKFHDCHFLLNQLLIFFIAFLEKHYLSEFRFSFIGPRKKMPLFAIAHNFKPWWIQELIIS
jgi:hypothetical protein